jgi:hypothetical protein
MGNQTTLRTLVDRELEARNTTFEDFIQEHLAGGGSINGAAQDLVRLTGIPLARRTVYRWVNNSCRGEESLSAAGLVSK